MVKIYSLNCAIYQALLLFIKQEKTVMSDQYIPEDFKLVEAVSIVIQNRTVVSLTVNTEKDSHSFASFIIEVSKCVECIQAQ